MFGERKQNICVCTDLLGELEPVAANQLDFFTAHIEQREQFAASIGLAPRRPKEIQLAFVVAKAKHLAYYELRWARRRRGKTPRVSFGAWAAIPGLLRVRLDREHRMLTMLITDRLMQQWRTSTSLSDLAISATIGTAVVGNILMAGFRLRRVAIAIKRAQNL